MWAGLCGLCQVWRGVFKGRGCVCWEGDGGSSDGSLGASDGRLGGAVDIESSDDIVPPFRSHCLMPLLLLQVALLHCSRQVQKESLREKEQKYPVYLF